MRAVRCMPCYPAPCRRPWPDSFLLATKCFLPVLPPDRGHLPGGRFPRSRGTLRRHVWLMRFRICSDFPPLCFSRKQLKSAKHRCTRSTLQGLLIPWFVFLCYPLAELGFTTYTPSRPGGRVRRSLPECPAASKEFSGLFTGKPHKRG